MRVGLTPEEAEAATPGATTVLRMRPLQRESLSPGVPYVLPVWRVYVCLCLCVLSLSVCVCACSLCAYDVGDRTASLLESFCVIPDDLSVFAAHGVDTPRGLNLRMHELSCQSKVRLHGFRVTGLTQ